MSRLIIRHPRAIITVVVLLTALLAFGLRKGLILDVSPLGFVESGSRERTDFEAARKNFGPEDYLIVAVVFDDVFKPANLQRLRALHDRLAKTSGVTDILSLINVPYARNTAD